MSDEKFENAETVQAVVAQKRKRATAPRKAKKPTGRKTLVAAVAALVVSLVDLFLLVRLGSNPFF